MRDRRGRRPHVKHRATATLAGLLVAAGVGVALLPTFAGAQGQQPFGFSPAFVEPTADGERTAAECVTRNYVANPRPDRPKKVDFKECKPAAGSQSVAPVLGDKVRIPYWDNLASTENVRNSIVAEYGTLSINDEARLLELNPAKPQNSNWRKPSPVFGGANPPANGTDKPPYEGGNPDREFITSGVDGVPGTPSTKREQQRQDPDWNDGSMFCADLNFLPDGRILVVGGTTYKNDPPRPGSNTEPTFADEGPVELEGMRNARIYDPRSNTFRQTGKMENGRWYPALVTLGKHGGRPGDMFVASGVKNLIRGYNNDEPDRALQNQDEVEIYDAESGNWETQGDTRTGAQDPSARWPADPADRPLPLFPRMHLLPNGHVYYDAVGQAFNPFGQDPRQGVWNMTAAYDPEKERWNELGLPTSAPKNPAVSGFRGSTFSAMQTLKPDPATGKYTKADFLVAGGIPGFVVLGSPGSYDATTDSRMASVDTANTSASSPSGTFTSRSTADDLSEKRWYGSSVVLPTGETIATFGADKDEVVNPGSENPVQTAEMFDPKTEQWDVVGRSTQVRTYHNTSSLLPDGRILVAGHNPISETYLANTNKPQQDGRNPTFEIFTPPYLRGGRGPRPKIEDAPSCQRYGGKMEIETDVDGREVDSVVISRNTSTTHITDGDQRTVELRILSRDKHGVTVARPPDANVAPPGPYFLFVNKKSPNGPIPSMAKQQFIGEDGCPRGAGIKDDSDDGDKDHDDRDGGRDKEDGGEDH